MEVQQDSLRFFAPVAVAYLLPLGAWVAASIRWPRLWLRAEEAATNRKWLDLALVLVAAVGILGIGQLYSAGLLLDAGRLGLPAGLAWVLNNLLIYSPLFIILGLRRQPLASVYCSPQGLWLKLLWGLGLGLAAVLLFHLLRGEAGLIGTTLAHCVSPKSLSNFPAVFLEGLALAFAFVRLRWAFGRWPALVIPALLFALAHVPGALAEGDSVARIAAFFIFNSAIAALILLLVERQRDIIALGIMHHIMDAAIRAY